MTLKFTGGEAKGREIKSRRGLDTRPTAAKLREALFTIVRDRVEGARWLDLYAGNGTVGLEALSRGASFVAFAERDKDACHLIRTNLKNLDYADKAFVWCADVTKLLSEYQAEPFDVAFMDPPWDKGDYKKAMTWLADRPLLKPDGMIIAEHRGRMVLPERYGAWHKTRIAQYGDAAFSFYTQPASGAVP